MQFWAYVDSDDTTRYFQTSIWKMCWEAKSAWLLAVHCACKVQKDCLFPHSTIMYYNYASIIVRLYCCRVSSNILAGMSRITFTCFFCNAHNYCVIIHVHNNAFIWLQKIIAWNRWIFHAVFMYMQWLYVYWKYIEWNFHGLSSSMGLKISWHFHDNFIVMERGHGYFIGFSLWPNHWCFVGISWQWQIS